ncbi:MAG: hypothetical protein Q9165_002620 [Trypethelium subeluteriae]
MADLEPSEFLQNIRELGEKREREDEERVRQLEAQILQDKSEREARRAGLLFPPARCGLTMTLKTLTRETPSISPQKRPSPQTPRSPAGTPPPATFPRSPRSPIKMNDVENATTHEANEPSSTNGTTPDETARKSPFPRSPAVASPTSDTSQSQTGSAASLGRSGTLTWNRRPNSGERNRPLSGLGRSTTSLRSPSKLSDDLQDKEQEQEPSRSTIAQSLGSKDPSWFRQTADRGTGSAAYRRSQEDSTSDDGFISGRRGLPGMSRESTAEPEKDMPSPLSSLRSNSPSRGGSVRGSSWSNRNSSQTSPLVDNSLEGKNIMPTTKTQKFEPPRIDSGNSVEEEGNSDTRSSAMSPAQGRIAAERPASPTKGMGGFVQSAMMKRSDSVNKRWSAQPGNGGLSRQNSTASNRSGYGGSALAGSTNLPPMEGRPASLSRGNSLEPGSRPTSSHSNVSDLTLRGEASTRDNDGFVKPSLPVHSRGKSISEAGVTDSITSPPLSPTKRYSPTKSTWLESALNKPESPKPKATTSQQPSWMTELAKAKQQRASANLEEKKATDNDIASFDALLNSRPGSPAKRQQASSEPVASAEVDAKSPSKLSDEEKPAESPQSKEETLRQTSDVLSSPAHKSPDSRPISSKEKPVPPATKPKPGDSPGFVKPTLTSPSGQPTMKSKPDTPPKKDFRSALKSRQLSAESSQKEEPEFRNVFGKLRKAETKNYVAPDELKNNILRGKAGLTLTGGPQRRERRDELKEDLLKQKEVMRQKASEEVASGRKNSVSEKPAAQIPEALQRRNKLSRSGSSVGTLPGSPATPSPSKAKSPSVVAVPDSGTDLEPTDKTTSPPPAAEATGRLAGGTSKLAARFNPGLANVLARGPSPMPNVAGPAKSNSSDPSSAARPSTNDEPSEADSSTPLTHMTKGRARGPKRRAPKSMPEDGGDKTTAMAPTAQLVKDKEIVSSLPSPKSPPTTRASSAVPTAQLVKPRDVLPSSPKNAEFESSSNMVSVADANSMVNSLQNAKPAKPATSKKSPLAELVAAKAREEKPEDVKSLANDTRPTDNNVNSKREKISNSGNSAQQITDSLKPAPLRSRSPVKTLELSNPPENSPGEADRSKTPSSVKDFASKWNRQDSATSPTKTRARSPIKLPSRNDEQNAMREAGLIRDSSPTKQPIGLGLGGVPPSPSASVTKSGEDSVPALRNKYPMSPPASTDLSKPSVPTPATPPKPSTSASTTVTPSASRQSSTNIPPPSPIPDTTAATETFKSFYGTCPTRSTPIDIDTASILSSRPGPRKLRTTRTSIHSLDPATGSLAPLPASEQHILYTGELYLCTHAYTDADNGTKSSSLTTSTYLWLGDDVPEAAASDSLVFARRHARDANSKLLQVRQNREPSDLLLALGGILIVRRGTRADPLASRGSSTSSTGAYMLCARRHLSHIAFDEVPLSRGSFCSGFPFVVLTPAQKRTFLWKGVGSGLEEYSTAKLTAMEVPGASGGGDMLDVEEGKEPRELHQVFFAAGDPVKNVARSAEHWRHKARCEGRYAVRLFRVEEGSAERAGRPGSSSSSSGGGAAGRVGSWMGSWSSSLVGRRPSQQQDEEEESGSGSPKRSTSPVKQRPDTPKGVGEGKPKITEMVPFCQRDLVEAKEAVWVLDAFFEVYVILGPHSNKHPALLPTALLFAQDYSILAASLEDRPFVPVGNVLMPGFFPRDLKAVFRGWRDEMTESFKEGRKEGKKVLGLGAAIAAVRQ